MFLNSFSFLHRLYIDHRVVAHVDYVPALLIADLRLAHQNHTLITTPICDPLEGETLNSLSLLFLPVAQRTREDTQLLYQWIQYGGRCGAGGDVAQASTCVDEKTCGEI